jgi:hypothetical protein
MVRSVEGLEFRVEGNERLPAVISVGYARLTITAKLGRLAEGAGGVGEVVVLKVDALGGE